MSFRAAPHNPHGWHFMSLNALRAMPAIPVIRRKHHHRGEPAKTVQCMQGLVPMAMCRCLRHRLMRPAPILGTTARETFKILQWRIVRMIHPARPRRVKRVRKIRSSWSKPRANLIILLLPPYTVMGYQIMAKMIGICQHKMSSICSIPTKIRVTWTALLKAPPVVSTGPRQNKAQAMPDAKGFLMAYKLLGLNQSQLLCVA